MINPSNILTVIKYDGSAYTNVSSEAADPTLDIFTHDFDTNKYLYVGYCKKIGALYIHLDETKNIIVGTMKLEYWNGTAWTQVTAVDQTSYLKRSGIINWAPPADAAANTVDGISNYWIRISGSITATPAVDISYVGLVFSDDYDIGLEYPSVLKECFYPQNESDFMIYHVSAKDYIMSELLRKGYTKTIDGVKEPINQWDVLDISELRQASLYYAMSQIFFNLSDNSNDNYWQKYLEYKSKFENAFNLGMLRIDQNNNGQVDPDENQPIKQVRWIR